MRTLIGWLSAWIAGMGGWWLGARIGFATAMMVSAVTGAIGLYAGFRWFDRNLK